MNRFLSILALCCACGCLQPPEPINPGPGPEPDVVAPVASETIDGFTADLNRRLRTNVYSVTAKKVRDKVWTTEKQLFDGELALIDAEFDAAAQGLANRMQREAGADDDKRMDRNAAVRERLAEERGQ